MTVSALLVGAAILAVGVYGFKEGIDFKGGSLWQFKVSAEHSDAAVLQNFIGGIISASDVRVSADRASGVLSARLPEMNEADHQKLLAAGKAKFPEFEEQSFSSIGPSVGAALRSNAILALFMVLVGISLYIAFAFRKVYKPVSSWKYGFITLATLIHDVAIPAGFLAVMGHFAGVEIDGNFVVALLVVMGFSVHDTIVVFDRIRENLLKGRGKEDFADTVNMSVNQTLGRSVNTSLTLILVLLALYILGPATLHYFDLTLIIGVTTGIYSSIFVASPLLLVWQRLAGSKRSG